MILDLLSGHEERNRKPKTHVKVYYCIQCEAAVKDAALFCSAHCRREWYKDLRRKR